MPRLRHPLPAPALCARSKSRQAARKLGCSAPPAASGASRPAARDARDPFPLKQSLHPPFPRDAAAAAAAAADHQQWVSHTPTPPPATSPARPPSRAGAGRALDVVHRGRGGGRREGPKDGGPGAKEGVKGGMGEGGGAAAAGSSGAVAMAAAGGTLPLNRAGRVVGATMVAAPAP